jgi:hypothetical protein
MSFAAHLSHPARQALGRWESTSGRENLRMTRSGHRLSLICPAKQNRVRANLNDSLSEAEMIHKVDLYKTQYAYDREKIYLQIRESTYGRDLGQSSWITLEEAQ